MSDATRRCKDCRVIKPESEFDGRKACNPCRTRRNAWLRKRHAEDPNYRAHNNRLQRDYNRRIGRTKISVGETATATCKRCGEEFVFTMGTGQARTSCDLCRQYNHDWRAYRLTGSQAREFRSRKCCDICGRTDSAVKGKALLLDHCHSTGVVRGVLCQPCNIALGGFDDDIDRMRAAISYLEKHR